MPIAVAATIACFALVSLAVGLPLSTGWNVHARDDNHVSLPPWHGWWEPHVGPGTVPAFLIGIAAIVWAFAAGRNVSWRGLLATAYLSSLAWLASLAFVDGTSGFSRVLGNPHEYLRTARGVHALGPLLAAFVDHIPLHSADHWPTHVAGHPPGMLLFFVALVRVGLGGDLAAGLVVTFLAATIAPAVLIVLKRLDAEATARSAAPFLVFTPAAVYLAVSADAVMATFAAWAMVLLAVAVTSGARGRSGIAFAAGLVFGLVVLMSYGLVLFGLVPVGLLLATQSFRLVLPCGIGAALVVLLPGVWGFWWPEAFGVLHDRYWDGVASQRPGTYWTWANLALLVATAGPTIGAGLTRLRELPRPAIGIVIGTLAAIALADASQMSRAEVERIWLPFVPWLTISLAAMPQRWQRPALAVQVTVGLLLQHLLYTSW